jgi:hypothetical protein
MKHCSSLRSTKAIDLLLGLCWCTAVGGAFAGQVDFTRPIPASFKVQPFPGHPAFVFTIYGAPAELEPLKQLVEVMRDQQLGNGFDPGPTPNRATTPVFDYLATLGWPVMCYPGCADMQIKGGRCVLGPENEAALAAMDRAGGFHCGPTR